MEYNLESKDINRVLAKFGAIKFVEIAQDGLTRAMITGQNFMVDATPVGVTGILSRSWDYYISGLKGTLANRKGYGVYVHEGTGPHWAPMAALKDWAELKGIPVRALQYSIAKKGTKANPFLAKAFEANKDEMTSIVLDRFTYAINNF